MENLSKISDNITQKITTKQIATGEKMDFDSAIESYKAEYASLESALGDYDRVKSPYAGYFVSSVDGYEKSHDLFIGTVTKEIICKDRKHNRFKWESQTAKDRVSQCHDPTGT